MSWENLNDRRWRMTSGAYPSSSIYVIEPAKDPSDKKDPPRHARRVPFGFSRVLDVANEVDPLLWEGD